MKVHALKPQVYWVGAVDFNLRNFHHYSRSPLGSTYNAYLIDDEKKVLVDSVSHKYGHELLEHIRKIIDPTSIDYIICNHLEQDHAGVLPHMVELCKPEKIFCSTLGLKSITGQFDTEGWPIEVVKDGQRLNIGKRNITFYEARMLHWPDSMFSYLEEDKILFSNDAFGQNIATSFRYADEFDQAQLVQALRNYYNNIVLPFSPQVLKLLERFGALGLAPDIIAPDHGLIFRTPGDVSLALQCYKEFAEQKIQRKAVIAYDTMWQATEKMAYAIGDGLSEEDMPYTMLNLQSCHCSEVMDALGESGALIVGSPTRNNMPMVGMVALLAHIQGLRPLNRIAATFGSHGWSGEAPKQMAEQLKAMDFELVGEPVRTAFGAKKECLDQCRELGRAVAKELKART